MKKFLFCLILALSACATTTDSETGLVKLNEEPKNCEFLYTIDTSVTDYKVEDAYVFLEKRILEQRLIGDSYYIVQQDTVENPEAIFGPKETYKFKTKVYNCQK
ncbi:MAG: hypothetical protein IKN73_03160 [Alphaproteobacteria bacterium]|nr:hypothetical protein [Alphaproteobacteria bacterium]